MLIENPGQSGSVDHLGVEVAGTGGVDAEQTRLADAGLASRDERDTTCCLRQAGQVLGLPHAERRVLGDLGGPGDSLTPDGEADGQACCTTLLVDPSPAQEAANACC